jgi:hypothetical protein
MLLLYITNNSETAFDNISELKDLIRSLITLVFFYVKYLESSFKALFNITIIRI